MKTFETPAFFRHERGFLWAYIIIAFVTIVGGAYAFNTRVQSIAPSLFALDVNRNDVLDPIQQRLKELADQKVQDSDGDGVNDFDEQFTYNTSPYLADSDSDGITDGNEIASGSDPACAAGLVCGTVLDTNTAVSTTSGLDTNSAASVLQDLSNLPPDQLRSQLATMGVSQAVLDSISDEELMTTYQQTLDNYTQNPTAASVNTSGTATTNADPYPTYPTSSTGASSLEQLRNSNISDIRALLKTNGVTDDQLNTVDDATLQQLFNDTLDEQTASQATQ